MFGVSLAILSKRSETRGYHIAGKLEGPPKLWRSRIKFKGTTRGLHPKSPTPPPQALRMASCLLIGKKKLILVCYLPGPYDCSHGEDFNPIHPKINKFITIDMF